jgi:hypothetical protein
MATQGFAESESATEKSQTCTIKHFYSCILNHHVVQYLARHCQVLSSWYTISEQAEVTAEFILDSHHSLIFMSNTRVTAYFITLYREILSLLELS